MKENDTEQQPIEKAILLKWRAPNNSAAAGSPPKVFRINRKNGAYHIQRADMQTLFIYEKEYNPICNQ